MQSKDDIHDIEQDDLHTPSPPPPHLSPVKTADVIKSVKRRMGWKKTPSPRTPRTHKTPRTRNRHRANANRGGANKSCKI